MKLLGSLAALAGVAILTTLVVYFGFGTVAEAVASVGYGALWVVVFRAIALCGAGLGWWLLLRGQAARSLGAFIGLRYLREAINTLVPVAQVGGDLIGARLLMSPRISGSLALASVLVDIFLQVVTLVVFALAGFGIIVAVVGGGAITQGVWIAIGVAIFAVLGFFLVLNFGAFEPLVRRLADAAERRNWGAFRHIAGLGESLQQIWRNRRGLAGALVVHLFTWGLGAAEIWVALYFMGHQIGAVEALAIESLTQAGRAAGFAIPGGLGVQDGALIAVSAVFGVPAELALAVALVKRIPDIVIGVPSLVAWQVLEGRKLLRGTAKARDC